MFTGLIRDIGTITHVEAPTPHDRILSIQTTLPVQDLAIGASVACDGVCMTVTHYKDGGFKVQAAAETIAVTNVGQWAEGAYINLEPSLRLGDPMGGHHVSGHVDGIALIRSVESLGEGWRITIAPPIHLQKYICVKGSVALNGISLTVNTIEADAFSVLIIPHTWTHTTLGKAKAGDKLHIEVDPIARYIERLLESRV